jgi:hypothetical protein
MNTFRSIKRLAIYLLLVAILIYISIYRTISFAYKVYLAFIDFFLKLKTFVEKEKPNNIKVVLKKTTFSAVRILKDENFQRRLSLSQ